MPAEAAASAYPRTCRMARWVYLLVVPMGGLFCAMGVALAFLLGDQLRSSGALWAEPTTHG